MAHAAGIRDTVQLRQAAEHRNAVMAPIMAAIAHNFICYGYTEEGPAPYLSNGWEVYFWCNNFSNTAHGCGLSGRDYSYFTLTFNERQTVIQRRELCDRLLEFLDTESFEERMAILQRMKGKAGQREVDSLCLCLDVKPSEGTIEEQLEDIKQCLRMQQRYDASRLRRR